jgi:hypothetical protein
MVALNGSGGLRRANSHPFGLGPGLGLGLGLAIVSCLCFGSAQAVAETEVTPPMQSETADLKDPVALAVVERMTARLVGSDRLAMHGEISWDVVQPDGRTLEFGATRKVVLRRPDRLRVELEPREGGAKRLLYDGSQLVLQDHDHHVYATVAQSGPVDDVVG